MANWLSQANRFLQLTTPLGEDELFLTSLTGTEEMSNLFNFKLNMFSDKTAINPSQIIGKPMSVKISQESNNRYIHGIVNSFHAENIENGKRYYVAYLKPWLNFLSYTTDYRIFQNKNVIDIIKIIFSEYNFTYYDLTNLNKTYSKREYCVQYRENTLNFVQRILEEEGIFYFFKHQKDKHILILGDNNSIFKNCMEDQAIFSTNPNTGNHLIDWNRNYDFYSGKYTQKDYNFENPDALLITQQQKTAKLVSAEKYNLFHYPGNYTTTESGKTLAQLNFEAIEAKHDIAEGIGNYLAFSAGSKFTLSGSPSISDEGDYILTAITHYAKDDSYLSGGDTSSTQQIYRNAFTCIPYTVNFRAAKNAFKPAILGAQTAIVVGPAGSELYTDQYGRVKVQFHWDRQGKKDDYSSCWVRVAQTWAGKNWGTLFMPRVGQEVVVQFLEGDPDRPLIIGSVYNSNNPPPYQLPSEQTQSGIKTRSTKGGSVSDSNELRFEDCIGQEEIYIQAQKDFSQNIKNNLNINIGNQSTIIAQQAIELKVGNNTLLINTQGIFINGETININN